MLYDFKAEGFWKINFREPVLISLGKHEYEEAIVLSETVAFIFCPHCSYTVHRIVADKQGDYDILLTSSAYKLPFNLLLYLQPPCFLEKAFGYLQNYVTFKDNCRPIESWLVSSFLIKKCACVCKQNIIDCLQIGMPVMRMVSNVVTNLLEVTRGLNVPSKVHICIFVSRRWHFTI